METVIAAVVAAIPATLGAWAAVIAAKRSGHGNRKLTRVERMLTDHLTDGEIHYLPDRRLTGRKEHTG